MSHAFIKGLAMAIATAPLLIACGGKTSAPAPITPAQCSGSSCPVQGPPPQGSTTAALCPADADIVNSTYLGGAGSGEIVSVNIDAVNMKYTLKWLESPIPETTGQVTPSRAGTTITGVVSHPPTGTLPTAEQTRCAFVLQPGSGTAPDGTTYSTAASFNAANPPMLLVGLGVAGGGIPGATVQFDGETVALVFQNVGAVPNRHFDFYPFIGFASTTNDISKLAGSYNGLMYHLVPSGQYATTGAVTKETFDANGACTSTNTTVSGQHPSSTGCLTTGSAWTANANGYFDSTDAPQIGAQFVTPLGTTAGQIATAHMVIGQLNGATVPIVVRTGFVNTGTPSLGNVDAQVDDESGIAMLANNVSLASGAIDGGYAGADSNFKYTATLLQGPAGSFINPSTEAAETGFGLDYTATGVSGLVAAQSVATSTAPSATGYVIATGGLYGALFNTGTNTSINGGVTSTSANSTTTALPYFGIGAQISK